jgi:pyruvate/2-oxoglutarate dehydrogenase complex dihydrolipoamide acyltransferase (E2) component
MATKRVVRLPDLGDIESAVVVEWLCEKGARLREGDDVVEVETEKTTFVVPSPADGVLTEVLVHAGDRVRVGDVLGALDA